VPRSLYLIDAAPYVFRAFFSLPTSLTEPSGEPVNAVYGFTTFLAQLLDQERPSHVAVAFDGDLTGSFRNETYPEYKAQREEPPAELVAQMDTCREAAEALGTATFIDDRYEADDIIATLCRRHDGLPRVVVTSDKDLAQLVGDGVTLYDFARGERYGPAEVMAKFGVLPEQIPDYLGLAGDSVDNIPGVRGVGPKTARALLGHFATLEEALQRPADVAALPMRGAKSLAAKLGEQAQTARLSKELATAAYDAPVDAGLDDLAWRGIRNDAVEELFDRLGFDSLRERLPR
jgi:DNA polymerase I